MTQATLYPGDAWTPASAAAFVATYDIDVSAEVVRLLGSTCSHPTLTPPGRGVQGTRRSAVISLESATPALPVRDVPRAVAFYRERLAFAPIHQDAGFAVLRRDGVEVILWAANDPSTRGAEPHLAGSASCRIRVSGLRELYASCQAQGVVHPNGALARQEWGVHDFSVLDADGNLIGFYEPVTS